MRRAVEQRGGQPRGPQIRGQLAEVHVIVAGDEPVSHVILRSAYFFAAAMSRIPRSASAYPATPKPATTPWLTAAVCDAGPRRIGFEMCTSMVGNFTCARAATRAG